MNLLVSPSARGAQAFPGVVPGFARCIRKHSDEVWRIHTTVIGVTTGYRASDNSSLL
jgi:hypothetical protein